MHYHLEVIMPPAEDIEAVIAQVLRPFDRNGKEDPDDDDGGPNRHGFWDFYVIGGRFAAAKFEATLDPARKEAFSAELVRRNVTVNSFRAGKEHLDPPSQVPMVDALWRESFPESPLTTCPFFAHFNDQYKHGVSWPDVMPLGDVTPSLEAARVIVAGPHWCDKGKFEATYMIQEDFWNGVTHVKAAWDGTIGSALGEARKRIAGMSPEYAARCMPKDDWLAVTVDYHS